MIEDKLWGEYVFADNIIDLGGSILYCLRYDKVSIEKHQKSIVNSLKSMGIYLEKEGDEILARPKKRLEGYNFSKFLILLEELSCANEAVKYSMIGFNQFNNISELSNGVMEFYSQLLEINDLTHAYYLAAVFIPGVASNLYLSCIQGGILSKSDENILFALNNFAEEKKFELERDKSDSIFN